MWYSLSLYWNGIQMMWIESKINILSMSRIKSGKTESNLVENGDSNPVKNDELDKVKNGESNQFRHGESNQVVEVANA